MKLGFVKPENIWSKQRLDHGQLLPCLVGVELARSAGVELDKHLVSPVVDVGGGVQSVLPDLVGRGELDVGDGGLDPLLLRPGGEGCGQRLLLAVSRLQLQVSLGEVSPCHRHPGRASEERLESEKAQRITEWIPLN